MSELLTRFDEAAKHYRLVRSEILEAGRSEWGVDPYEWECFSRMSPIEKKLWEAIRSADAVFYPQFPIGRFFADFCNPVAGVVIECDGAMWHQDEKKDAAHQKAIELEGFIVYRITGKQCNDEKFCGDFVREISERHSLVRGFNDHCVAWDAQGRRYVVGSRSDMKNFNAGRAMDQMPGYAVIRDQMNRKDAIRLAEAMSLSLRTTGDLEG